jgi:hypothetical protein
MGKYGESLGVFELKVGGFDKPLHPVKGDNLRLSKLLTEVKKKNDESFMISNMKDFIYSLIEREYPPLNEDEKKELDMFVEFNILDLIKELLIAFRWTKRETFDKQGDDAKKSVMQMI